MEYKSVVQLMIDHFKETANRHPLETVNIHMRNALIGCSTKAKSKSEFVTLVKQETGLTDKGIARSEAVNYLMRKFDK